MIPNLINLILHSFVNKSYDSDKKMSAIQFQHVPAPKEEDLSLHSDNSSDGDFELREIRPQIVGSGSSSLIRKRRKCCTCKCMSEWTTIVVAYLLLYATNGLFTYAMIEAMLANTYDTLVAFGVIWVVFVIVFFGSVIFESNRKLKERLAHQRAVEEAELRRREGIKAALEDNEL